MVIGQGLYPLGRKPRNTTLNFLFDVYYLISLKLRRAGFGHLGLFKYARVGRVKHERPLNQQAGEVAAWVFN
jgi:hypothetical protein